MLSAWSNLASGQPIDEDTARRAAQKAVGLAQQNSGLLQDALNNPWLQRAASFTPAGAAAASILRSNPELIQKGLSMAGNVANSKAGMQTLVNGYNNDGEINPQTALAAYLNSQQQPTPNKESRNYNPYLEQYERVAPPLPPPPSLPPQQPAPQLQPPQQPARQFDAQDAQYNTIYPAQQPPPPQQQPAPQLQSASQPQQPSQPAPQSPQQQPSLPPSQPLPQDANIDYVKFGLIFQSMELLKTQISDPTLPDMVKREKLTRFQYLYDMIYDIYDSIPPNIIEYITKDQIIKLITPNIQKPYTVSELIDDLINDLKQIIPDAKQQIAQHQQTTQKHQGIRQKVNDMPMPLQRQNAQSNVYAPPPPPPQQGMDMASALSSGFAGENPMDQVGQAIGALNQLDTNQIKNLSQAATDTAQNMANVGLNTAQGALDIVKNDKDLNAAKNLLGTGAGFVGDNIKMLGLTAKGAAIGSEGMDVAGKAGLDAAKMASELGIKAAKEVGSEGLKLASSALSGIGSRAVNIGTGTLDAITNLGKYTVSGMSDGIVKNSIYRNNSVVQNVNIQIAQIQNDIKSLESTKQSRIKVFRNMIGCGTFARCKMDPIEITQFITDKFNSIKNYCENEKGTFKGMKQQINQTINSNYKTPEGIQTIDRLSEQILNDIFNPKVETYRNKYDTYKEDALEKINKKLEEVKQEMKKSGTAAVAVATAVPVDAAATAVEPTKQKPDLLAAATAAADEVKQQNANQGKESVNITVGGKRRTHRRHRAAAATKAAAQRKSVNITVGGKRRTRRRRRRAAVATKFTRQMKRYRGGI